MAQYQYIDDYLSVSVREYIKMRVDKKTGLFRNQSEGHIVFKFFKGQPLGEPHIRSIIKNACSDDRIVGIGPNCAITTHSLRKPVKCILIESRTLHTAKSIRIGHLCVESVRTYQHIAVNEVSGQISAIFKGSSSAHVPKYVNGHAGPNKYELYNMHHK